MRAGAVLDAEADYPQQVLFATGTLPGSTYESKLAIAAWSGYAVNAIKAWFAKRVPAKIDMYVWEFQKRGALHLHYAILVKDDAIRARLLKEWKPQWERIIDAIGKKAGVDMWRKNANYTHANNKEVLQADIQECTKSIACYLSKYVSKSQQQYLNNHWKQCKPSRFWGISRPLCALLEQRTVTEEVVLKNRMQLECMYEDCLSVLQSNCPVVHTYEVKQVRAKVLVAYSNVGEQSWLLSKLVTQSSSRGRLYEMSQSEQDKLCLQIQRCLNQSKTLRSVVQRNSADTYLGWVLNMDSLESVSSAIKDSLILDFRWFIWQTMENSSYVPAGLRQTHAALRAYCMAHLAPYSSTEATEVKTENTPPSLEKPGNSQLTLGL
jgi:hypothetical protein